MKVKKVFLAAGGTSVCPRQRAKSLMSFHCEGIHYVRLWKCCSEYRTATLSLYICEGPICWYIYICMYVCIYICMYIYTHTYIYVESLRQDTAGDSSLTCACEEQKNKGGSFHYPIKTVLVCYFIQVNWTRGRYGGGIRVLPSTEI